MRKAPPLPGRTPIEVVSHNLTHVSKTMLRNVHEDAKLPEGTVNTEMQAMSMAYTHLINFEIQTHVACRAAMKKGDAAQGVRLLGIVEKIVAIKKEWPMKVVG